MNERAAVVQLLYELAQECGFDGSRALSPEKMNAVMKSVADDQNYSELALLVTNRLMDAGFKPPGIEADGTWHPRCRAAYAAALQASEIPYDDLLHNT